MASRKSKKTRPSEKRTLADHLSHLTLRQAEKLLGQDGKHILMEGGKCTVEPEEVDLTEDAFILDHAGTGAKVTIWLNPEKKDRLDIRCSRCGPVSCLHMGAALSFILEEKVLLGLAEPPPERVPAASLSEEELVAQAIRDREERAREEKMWVRALDPKTPWTDYTVTSRISGKTYRVALRGWEPGRMYCTCPDFRKNTLGLCKHTLHVAAKVRRKFPRAVLDTPWKPDAFAVSVRYGAQLAVRLEGPAGGRGKAAKLAAPWLGKDLRSPAEFRALLEAVRNLENLGREVTLYPDAEEFITRVLDREALTERMGNIRKAPEKHPLRQSLLKAPLLPYQLDGIAFAVGAGRAMLADDMGLGKTIQGIGVAELLSREAGISKVLVVCPASVKSQWASEIENFCDRNHQIILGPHSERVAQYANDAFFTICNYEQVLRDQIAIEQVPWDLIILDEAQRIKNWEAKTSNVVKSLRSTYALTLTGTPLENRIDELYSIIEFIDDRRLGPAFRFFNRHRLVDEKGKVLGYKNLAELRERLKPVLLRRTRASILSQLPPRTNEVVRIEPTEEQSEICSAQMRIVSSIVRKNYINEMDLMRLRKALLTARMSADSTFLVHKCEPSFSSKIERLRELLGSLAAEEDRKIIIFSEWTTMLNLIEPLLGEAGLEFVRLDGSIPQKKRRHLMSEFNENPDCRVFLSTNAGSTGLNLQAANTVINIDLPWNPAVLEQRIGRAHRMGQKRPVQVYILVTEGTIEESMLATLSAKHELARAALDVDSPIDSVDLASGMDELKARLEILLGAAPEAPVDESTRRTVEKQAETLARQKERMGEAGGELLAAAFGFIDSMLPEPQSDSERQRKIAAAVKENFARSIEKNDDGSINLTVKLPAAASLDRLAEILARLADFPTS